MRSNNAFFGRRRRTLNSYPFTGWNRGAEIEGAIEEGYVIEVATITIGFIDSGLNELDMTQLKGDGCDRATHYVRAATTGAFALTRGVRTERRTVADVFGIAAGAKSNWARSENIIVGSLETCRETNSMTLTAPPHQCRTPLRLFLQPLVEHWVLPETMVQGKTRPRCSDRGLLQGDGRCLPVFLSSVEIESALRGRAFSGDGPRPTNYGELCEEGVWVACTNLGLELLYGAAEAEPAGRAVELFEKACAHGVTEACIHLGVCHERGYAGVTDCDRALALFEAACENGSMIGCGHLGRLQREDSASLEKSFVSLSRACEQDVSFACAALAELYDKETSFPGRDLRTAAELFEKACHLGEPRACTEAAFALVRQCPEEPCDESRTVELYTKACKGGDAWGCWWSGTCHREGIGTSPSITAAKALYKRGCAMGDPASCAEYWRKE